jgi:MoaA/NifB/PqqE/SkfB family radical SAM enzyme
MNKRRLRKAISRIRALPLNHYLLLYLLNKAKHYYYKFSHSTRVARPSTIMLELTNHCNLACTTCPREYDFGKAMDKGSMDKSAAFRIIDDLWPYLDSIGLTGMGETFMYREIEEIAGYIKSKNKGIVISVSTNAQLPGFFEKIKNLAGKIDTIQVSVDGLGDVYEQIRKKADFSTLDENLKQLSMLCRNTKTDVMLNMVVTRENYMQMPLIVDFAAQRNIRYVDFTLFNLAAVTNIDPSYYRFYESPEFLAACAELDKRIEENKTVEVTRYFRTEKNFRKCSFPWTHFYVCWNGFMVPCCAKPFPKELNFGNAFESGIMEVLNSPDYRKFRELWYAGKTPGFCRKCHFTETGLN